MAQEGKGSGGTEDMCVCVCVCGSSSGIKRKWMDNLSRGFGIRDPVDDKAEHNNRTTADQGCGG